MRAAAILVLASWGSWAGTTICETRVTSGRGSLATGSLRITPTAPFVTPAGARVEKIRDTLVVNGRFCAILEPNDTGVPANTQYKVEWLLDNAAPRTEWWTVPTTGTALRVMNVATAPVLPSQMVSCSQISGTCAGAWPMKGDTGPQGPRGPAGGAGGAGGVESVPYAFDFSATTYNTGTVDVTNGSNAIVGHGTTWTSAMTGMLFIPRLANCNRGYKFTYVDATDGTLEATYGTGSDSGHPCPSQLLTEYQLSDIISVPASTHQLGTADITIQCFDANTPRNVLHGSAFAAGPSVDPETYDVQIVFWSTEAGRCILQQ